MTIRTVYIGMALTHAPDQFRAMYSLLVTRIEAMGIEVLTFVGLTNGDALTVYDQDRMCTENADLAIFICDHPSIGLGMEIAFRLATRKPMLLFSHKNARVTRMLSGCALRENISFLTYESPMEILVKVQEMIRK